MKNKFIKTLFLLAAFGAFGHVSAKEYVKNDLTTLFLNNEAVIYGINMRSFNADDKNGNGIIDFELGETSGNFLNAIERLDELKEYGINTIHLMPITPVGKLYAKGTAGSLFAMSSFDSIDPKLADPKSKLSPKEQAKKFVEECHKRNIRVFADLPACGSYEMTQLRPDLFLKDENGEFIIPADWYDVRLFKVKNDDEKINQELVEEHKKFIDMVMELGFDGLRADCATIKYADFWKPVVKYAKSKDSEFLMLAEAYKDYIIPISPYTGFTNYKKLFKAGFDGYYGRCFEFLNFSTPERFEKIFTYVQKKRYGKKKAMIGGFKTHDKTSPYLVSDNFAQTIMYLNATLPVNPYYLDGFPTGDKYIYPYAGKYTEKTYTDDHIYFVEEGQFDIFNYSRKPGGNEKEMEELFKKTIQLRKDLGKIVTKGKMKMLETSDENVYAYERYYKDEGIIVIMNRNQKEKTFAYVEVNPDKLYKVNIITDKDETDITRGKIVVNLPPGKTAVVRYKL